MPNTLYYGDNLQVLREHLPDASVDLVYLDPPFNSNASYNVLFREKSGEDSPAQIKAFTDTWEWTLETERTFEQDIILHPGTPAAVKDMITAFRQFIGNNAMMAYLVMMTPRLVELRRVLKPTGSLYLHCDPTASHYLKILLDAVFGSDQFRSEVIWRRSNAHNKLSKQYGPIHDTLLFYTKTQKFTFHPGRRPYTTSYVERSFPQSDERGHYQSNVLTGMGMRTGESGHQWQGYDPTKHGRHWAIPAKLREEVNPENGEMSLQELLNALDAQGMILHPKSKDGIPRYKQYLDSSQGVLHQDIWAFQPGTQGLLWNSDEGIDEDIKWLDNDRERLGYPTQKPEALLERIIQASSNEGDVVLDPFCGCGTAVAAAEKLNRRWVGIDITHLAVALMKNRLKTMFNIDPGQDYDVVGEPQDVGSARALWEQDPYQFQFWAVSLLEAQPQSEQKRGADRGIDGMLYFVDGPPPHPAKGGATGEGRPGVISPNPGLERGGGAGEGGLGPVHNPGRANPGHAFRGSQRRLLSLRPVAAGLSQDTATHHRGTAVGPGLRVATPPAQLPTRRAGASARGGTGPVGGGGSGGLRFQVAS